MAITFKLELDDGTPADPPVLQTAVPNWSVGDTIPLGLKGDPRRWRRSVEPVVSDESRTN
jgi:hypothetical protein